MLLVPRQLQRFGMTGSVSSRRSIHARPRLTRPPIPPHGPRDAPAPNKSPLAPAPAARTANRVCRDAQHRYGGRPSAAARLRGAHSRGVRQLVDAD